MRKLLFIMLLLPCMAYAQGYDDIQDDEPVKRYRYKAIKTLADSVDYQLDYMRACMAKHASQYYTGVALTSAGGLLFSLGSIVAISELAKENPNTGVSSALFLIGGGLATAGSITVLVSHKWFKRASLNPMPGKLSFRIEF